MNRKRRNMNDNWLPSLKNRTPLEGFWLAVMLSRR
ncbi:hypothetical protein ABJ713_004614 [Escherichia coli]